jgi:translocation and assembly module TamB
VDLASLGRLLVVQRDMAGTLTANARVTGSAADRRVTGTMSLANGVVDGYAFQLLDGSLDYAGERARVDATLVQAPNAQLSLSGTVPVSLERGALTDGPMSLDIKSAGIDLAVLAAAFSGVDAVSGTLVLDVHVAGTGTEPRAIGAVAVHEGAFTLAATGATYTDATIDAKVQDDELQVARLVVHDDSGQPLEGSGRLRLQRGSVRDIDFTLNATDFKVLDNEFGQLSVDSTLNVLGTLLAPRVSGLVRLRSGRLEVDALLDRFSSSAYESDAQPIAATARPDAPATGEAAPPGPASTAGSSRPLAFNVTVQVPNNLVLRGRDIRTGASSVDLGGLNVTAGGEFTLRREDAGYPVLIGTINTVRGTYDFQGRRFDVLRDGRIVFRGNRPIDPALDVSAERVISGVVAHVNVGGTMREPRLTLTSQPPLDEADILSLIVFNQPVNRLGQGQLTSLGERAAQMASGFVVTPLADSIGRVLDLDLFELDTIGDERGGPSVTLGEQVGERLFLKFRQIFGTQDISEFQLEYQLADVLRLQGSLAQGQGSANRSLTRRVERGGIDLVVFFSY